MTGEEAMHNAGIRRRGLLKFFLFGVILPLITICMELAYRICANALFDTLPSLWQVGLVMLVPLTNLGIFLTLTSPQPSGLRALLRLSSGAIAISAFYTILFIPILPIAIISVVFMGFGLLPLTPLISLVATIALRARLSNYVKQIGGKSSFWP
jgi:hypothetical protein